MKKESQQNQSRWWIWYHNAVWGIRTCLPRLRRKARRKPNLKVRTYLWARWMSSTQERRDPYETDHHPAIVSSESVDRQVRGDPYSSETSEALLNKPTKIPKPNINENHEQVRGNCFFRKTGMVARIQRKSCGWLSSWTQRLTREFFSWIIFRATREVWIWVNSVYTHFPKDRNCEICQRTDQNHKSAVKKTYWQSRTSCRKFWWFDYRRSQSSQWRLWISKQSSICSRGARLGHPMDRVVSVQDKKLLRKHKGACKSSWSRMGSLKSFTLTIPWNLAKPVKIFPGIIPRPHRTDRKQMGLLREQCAE